MLQGPGVDLHTLSVLFAISAVTPCANWKLINKCGMRIGKKEKKKKTGFQQANVHLKTKKETKKEEKKRRKKTRDCV